jgi:UDP-N-acetylglucosamine 2-epimerase
MLDQMLKLFEIVPDYDLDIMRPGQTLGSITSSVLSGLPAILDAENPDWVIVQGDTTTAMASCLAAHYQRIRVAHVEAGLRTGDIWAPHPEEVNRRVVGTIAELHFAPTEWAAQNLLAEGIPGDRISVTGNTVIDALRYVQGLPFDPSEELRAAAGNESLVLVTAHRRENLGLALDRICLALRGLARRNPGVNFAFPVHLNPNVQLTVHERLGGISNIFLMDPLDYPSLVWLLERSKFVITDSGGLQEEAAGVGRPVLVLRDSTERPEGVEAGTARLVGTDRRKLAFWSGRLLDERGGHLQAMAAQARGVYGDGTAALQIADALDPLVTRRVRESGNFADPVEADVWATGSGD